MNQKKSSQANSTKVDSTARGGKENDSLVSNQQRVPPHKRKACDNEVENAKEQNREVKKKRKMEEKKKREAIKKKRAMQIKELEKIWHEKRVAKEKV